MKKEFNHSPKPSAVQGKQGMGVLRRPCEDKEPEEATNASTQGLIASGSEYNLSEKFVRDYWNKEAIKDVKEFIKIIMKELASCSVKEEMEYIIKKRAGKELI